MPGAGFDVIVVGGGSAGCVLASRLSEDEERSVCLVEAGPDYGAGADGWPEDILDGRVPAGSHHWSDAEESLPAGRILGGGSALNMCTLMHGAPADYAGWAEVTGEPGLSLEGFAPYLERAEKQMAQRRFSGEELDPWYRGMAAAAEELGLPVHEDANDPAATEGIGPVPMNLRGTKRWNAVFVYLDPARERPNLTILSGTLADRVVFDGERATGVEVAGTDGVRMLEAGLVVVCSGAYGSPAVLMRSGIGPEEELRRHGVASVGSLPVGEGLRDHFGIPVRFSPSEEMLAELTSHRERFGEATIQGVFKARSETCPQGDCDLHLLTAVFPGSDGPVLASSSMLLQAEWTGSVRLQSADPARLPVVSELALESDADLAAAFDGVELTRRLAATEALRERIGAELAPGTEITPEGLRAAGRPALSTYFHPVATCAMGPVTDAAGRVNGFENLHVVDASAIPQPLRASPHLTVLALAERAAEVL